MTHTVPVPLLVNPHAGHERVDPHALAAQLTGGDTSGSVQPELVEPALLTGRIKQLIADGVRVIAVAGGDGSLHNAANAMTGSDCALAIVPTGTLNNFARRIGIPDMQTARTALARSTPEWIPLGTVGGELFLNTVTFGEYSRTVSVRERLRRYLGKWPAALVGFIRVLTTLRTFDVDLEVDGRRVRRTTPFIWVGIGWGSFPRVTEALERRSEPELEIAVLRARTPWQAAAFVFRSSVQMMSRDYPVRDRLLEIFHSRSVTVHTRHTLYGTTDGEVMTLRSPVQMSVRDRGVRVLRPHTRSNTDATDDSADPGATDA